MRIYNYIFFKIYQTLSVFDESPSFAAIIVLCWLFLFNSCTIISCAIKDSVFTSYFCSYIITVTILIILVHFLYFYRKGKHLRIIEEYKNENKRSSTIGIIGAFLYVFFTVWVFFKYAVPIIGGVLK